MTDTENVTDNDKTPNEGTEDVNFTFATHTDPQRQRDPHGVYLDDINRINAEIHRAKIEGREPDLKNPPATAGDVLQQTETLAKTLPGDYRVPVSKTLPVDLSEEGVGSARDERPDSPIVEDNDQTVGNSGYVDVLRATGKTEDEPKQDETEPETEPEPETKHSLPPIPNQE